MAKQKHLCRHSWAVISIHKEKKHKNIICLLAKNPAWYNRKCVFNTRILCPNSYRSRWSGMASHTLLQRRSAPWKAVRLLPDKRGQLASPIFCLCAHLAVNILIKLWFLSSLAFASPERGGKCRALRGDRGKGAYTGQNHFWAFYWQYSYFNL